MQFFTCCMLLLCGVVATAPIRAQRENVLSFLSDALGTTTERSVPARITANRKPPTRPEKEQDSDDLSEENSRQTSDTSSSQGQQEADKNGSESRDLDSQEIVASESKVTTGAGKENIMDNNSRPAQDHMSQGQRERQGSRGLTDPDSEEVIVVRGVEAENVPGKHVACSCGDRAPRSPRQSTGFQIQTAPGRVPGMNGMLAPGRSREILDPDSLEENYGRPAAAGNGRLTDYDETREYFSSETYPFAPPEQRPSGLSVPARSRAA
ncbi:uncharacterized protein LOC125015917 isoform X1 [Mugil cephalus]|uniref:uncharacterized protein LOC125015917 isoform X1 n=1 Tax=Mugil cephalus TaxID=48193 RepID=UPI001FB6DB68|nr:uncharacterized protein LOC125015917 isoform X1 [Mugil cephalus]